MSINDCKNYKAQQIARAVYNGDVKNQFKDELNEVLDEVRSMLIQKNEAYGDAALNPVRIFSKADPLEQLKVRIDDKLSRLARGDNAGEDVIHDLLGYLIIYRIQMKRLKPYNPC
jgi:hypothetical protein